MTKTRDLLFATLAYGVGDVIVLAVGGFVLLPMYTRVLSQGDFGNYVIVKTNVEIFTYLLYFGLPSAAGRVYFDYRKSDQQFDYLSSIVNLYLLSCVAFACVFSLWGGRLWSALSPATPSRPYLWFSLALAGTSFFPALGTLWLRLERRAPAFVATQIGAAVVLVVAAILNLVVLRRGLPGLLWALLLSSLSSAAVLPWMFGRRFRLTIHLEHVTRSLRFAVPVLIGYIAYFILNRISTLILQRHVPTAQIAIFGLAQQLAMLVTVVATAFGKALQPIVFGADQAAVTDILNRAARVYILLMFCVAAPVILFGWEALVIIAPRSYSSGYGLMLILTLAALVYSFSLITDTTLLYYRRPNASLAISLFGAAASLALSLWMVPLFKLRGAAFAIALAFAVKTFVGHGFFRRQTGQSFLYPMLWAIGAAGLLAAVAVYVRQSGFAPALALTIKLVVLAATLGSVAVLYLRRIAVRDPVCAPSMPKTVHE